MKINRNNKIIIVSIVGVIFIVALVVFILNYSKDDYSFSLLEKKWIQDNTSNVIDVSVFNDIPVYGQNGSGVIFDYLDEFTHDYDINFNKISYDSSTNSEYKDIAFKVVDNATTLKDNDILIYEDKYVVVSKDQVIASSINDLQGLKIGVLSQDLSDINYYLYSDETIYFSAYNNFDDMLKALDEEEINCLAIPLMSYYDDILSNELNIIYHIDELSKKYILTINNNDTLLSIMKKYNQQFMNENYMTSYKNNYNSLIFRSLDISEADRASYNSTPYTVGYVAYMPYTYIDNNEFVGTISNYLSKFEELFDVNFKFQKYNTIKELQTALSQGEVDLAFSNFDTSSLNIDVINTISPFNEQYVVLSNENLVVNSLHSLKNEEVYTVTDSYLYNNLRASSIKINGYEDTDELLRHIDNNSTVVIDLDTYNYYKNQKLGNYNVVYTGTLPNEYSFIIRDVNKNTTFSKLFTSYVSSINYSTIKFAYNTTSGVAGSGLAADIAKYLLIGLAVIAIVVVAIIIIRRKNKDKAIKKEEKLKFIDMMTSLKNRNYLNYNIEKWEENVIYPQAIVVIDLNNIKFINDNYGHEEGDNVIKKAASILIVNQKENTDIIRTDGNEFLIYMVGYDEKAVVEFTRKLYKDLKELPHNFGASLGYSMITDDIKTIDDAINEAVLDMREAKEKQ